MQIPDPSPFEEMAERFNASSPAPMVEIEGDSTAEVFRNVRKRYGPLSCHVGQRIKISSDGGYLMAGDRYEIGLLLASAEGRKLFLCGGVWVVVTTVKGGRCYFGPDGSPIRVHTEYGWTANVKRLKRSDDPEGFTVEQLVAGCRDAMMDVADRLPKKIREAYRRLGQ